MTNWNDALRDVRNAYRIVAAYQERVARTIQSLSAEFPDHRYHAWSPVQTESMPRFRGTTPPMERSPWDALPCYNFSILLTPREITRIRKGQCMIEISVEADGAFDAPDKDQYGREDYPDPAKLEPAAGSESILTMVAWIAGRNFPAEKTWFDTFWKKNNWPEELGEVQPVAGAGCSVFLMQWPLEQVFAAADLSVFTKEFKTALAKAADISL